MLSIFHSESRSLWGDRSPGMWNVNFQFLSVAQKHRLPILSLWKATREEMTNHIHWASKYKHHPKTKFTVEIFETKTSSGLRRQEVRKGITALCGYTFPSNGNISLYTLLLVPPTRCQKWLEERQHYWGQTLQRHPWKRGWEPSRNTFKREVSQRGLYQKLILSEVNFKQRKKFQRATTNIW